MGAWNTGNFENDTALDFVAEISSLDDLKKPIDDVIAAADDYIDADEACEALAAADLLAGMLGRPAEDVPEEASALVAKFGTPSDDLLAAARSAVQRIAKGSELAELWHEDDGTEWDEVVVDLLKRLDPNVNYILKKPKPKAKGGFICTVCEDFIADDELVRIEFNFLNMPGTSMGRYFHQSCIDANFKPPYTDKKGEASSSLKKQINKFIKQRDKENGAV